MASASDHRAHAALQPADRLILLPQRLPAAVEPSIGPSHYPAECTQSDAFLQPSLRARNGRANSNSFVRNQEGAGLISDQRQTAFKKHSAFNVSAAIRLRPSPARIRLAGSGGRERRKLAHESASFSEHDFAGHAPISIRAPSAPINNLRLHI